MEVGLERGAEALDEADGAGLPRQSELTPAPPLVGGENAKEEVEHRRGEADVPGQVPADALGEGQGPLSEGDVGQDTFDQVDGGVMCPARIAGGANPSALAGEGYQHWTLIRTWLTELVEELRAEGHARVHHFAFNPTGEPCGEDWNPSAEAHAQMAEELTAFLRAVGW